MSTLPSSIRNLATVLLAFSQILPLQAATDTAAPAAGAKKPNIVFFLVDDMGWMDSEPYGSKYYDTPNMQRLAHQGMLFTRAYSQPNCSPTRASILSGQYSSRHGILGATGHKPPAEATLPPNAPPNRPVILPESKTFLDPSQYTLAEALHDAGYRTGHFGKWHLGLTSPHWPEKQGFDVAFHAEPSAGPPNGYFSPYGVQPPPAPGTPLGELRHTQHGTITDGPAGEYISDRLTNEAITFIRDNKDRPFFLNLWHYGVHGPWGHKESLTEQMAKRTDPTGRQDNPVMASMLKSVDESLGRILDELDAQGLADKTIFIFASDNGGNVRSMTKDETKAPNEEDGGDSSVDLYRKWAGSKPPTSNAPLRDGKGTVYEGGVRVPLIVSWPGKIAAGSINNDTVVGCIDYYPTLLDLAGIAANPQQKIDGVSFGPVLRGRGKMPRENYFIWFPQGQAGACVYQGDWKLIRRFWERPNDWEGTRQLFNLKDDPGESKNLADEMPEKVKELDALIDQFLKDTSALLPVPNPAAKRRAETSSNN